MLLKVLRMNKGLTLIGVLFCLCLCVPLSATEDSDGLSNAPKVKNLEQTKHIKDYVEGAQARSYEHDEHSHPIPKVPSGLHRNPSDDSYSLRDSIIEKHYGDEGFNIHGEAAKYKPPTAYEDNVLNPVRRIEDTEVDCQKNHMIVTFKFSAPFNGFVYPNGLYKKCILFTGQNSNEATLILYHGPCGFKHLGNANDPEFSAVIEHRLMIQWEKDFVCEDDSSVIVRCDRPDDFNKTISWNFETNDLASTLERNTHPGPSMWMAIQRGEGPSAPSLDDRPVFIGDVLTVVFTLSDEVFWFGSNILSCVAIQGGDTDESVYEGDKYSPATAYSGRMTVIENECSTKPKIFSHIYKERITKDGKLVNLHYAHFKAFRFPTSYKVIIQCDVQVCYKNCDSLPPCSTGFQPRAAIPDRKRRDISEQNKTLYEEGTELDTVLLYRTIEVFSAEDGAIREIPVKTVIREPQTQTLFGDQIEGCYSSKAFYSWISAFAIVSIFLLVVLIWNIMKSRSFGKDFETPSKTT